MVKFNFWTSFYELAFSDAVNPPRAKFYYSEYTGIFTLSLKNIFLVNKHWISNNNYISKILSQYSFVGNKSLTVYFFQNTFAQPCTITRWQQKFAFFGGGRGVNSFFFFFLSRLFFTNIHDSQDSTGRERLFL